jgi:hypothetical protein
MSGQGEEVDKLTNIADTGIDFMGHRIYIDLRDESHRCDWAVVDTFCGALRASMDSSVLQIQIRQKTG